MYQELLHRLANLLSVKSLFTISVMVVFAVLALQGRISEDVVMNVVMMVVAFYFGTQHERQVEERKTEPKKQTNITI